MKKKQIENIIYGIVIENIMETALKALIHYGYVTHKDDTDDRTPTGTLENYDGQMARDALEKIHSMIKEVLAENV